jgi:tRNA threonylcarbamoyl adenosine modification protein YeaZ
MEPHKIEDKILSIECAVARGSVAVLDAGSVIASTDSRFGNPSRAEEILVVIKGCLNQAGIALGDIDLIAVSTGPGSYSGIRIGLATATGLGSALSVPCAGVSVLDAMAAYRSGSFRKLMTAVPVGKRYVAWRSFQADENGPKALSLATLRSESDFVASLEISENLTLVSHNDLFLRLADRVPKGIEMLNAGTNLADFVGRFAAGYPGQRSLKPIYLRSQNCATDLAGS